MESMSNLLSSTSIHLPRKGMTIFSSKISHNGLLLENSLTNSVPMQLHLQNYLGKVDIDNPRCRLIIHSFKDGISYHGGPSYSGKS